MMSALSHGISLKKKYGQHFLRDSTYVDQMLDAVSIDKKSCIFEIGGGDGFLTRKILERKLARLWVFEIDSEWAQHLKKTFDDARLRIVEENILDIDFSIFKDNAPWILLANLPYQITFPILHRLQQHRDLIKEGVVMVQEEVAQKVLKTQGRGYGYPSLFFQYYFDWKKLSKVPPTAFFPPPKVFSRLLYFKPKKEVKAIPDEQQFWKFIKICFKQPRRTLKNNLVQSHIDISRIPQEILKLRGQQLSMEDFLNLWKKLRS